MNAGSTHIEVLQKFVKENQLDVGFAFDGDADRCIAVDENGSVVDGDLILYVYGRYLKEKGKLRNNTVVTTIMSNFGLYKAFDELGVDYEKTQDALKTTQLFPFSEEGKAQVIEWLNASWEEGIYKNETI